MSGAGSGADQLLLWISSWMNYLPEFPNCRDFVDLRERALNL